MISWSATMSPTRILYCVLATWLLTAAGAITVSIDRSDVKPSPTRSSMIANGWRPLANGYEDSIGTNVLPSSNLERNAQPHPVLGKLQEHMVTSEKLKSQRKNKPANTHHDYNPPSILGSFTVFGHAATKARGEAQKASQQAQQAQHAHSSNTGNKYVTSETREYTFLMPPPKDAYRFDSEPPRKVVRDNSYSIVNEFLRQPVYVPPQVHQVVPDPVRAATYFIKGYTSTTNPTPPTPSKNRPPSYSNGYPGVPQLLQPPRHQAKPFESLKISGNAKPYLQPPNSETASEFGKDDRIGEHKRRPTFDRYQQQQQQHQIHGGPGGSGNFYSQVNHSPHRYKTSYERDPSFLVHESHEVSYVTPSSIYNEYNFRPSVPYDTLLPPEVYSTSSSGTPSTTVTPRIQDTSKYSHSNDVAREDEYYKTPIQSTTIGHPENTLRGDVSSTSGIDNTYYVSEHQDLTPPPSSWPVQKNKYTSDINEVLPRVNPPTKFSPEIIPANQLPQIPKMVYVRPQMQQYQTPIVPSQPEYETPESISLKHFNEQQFLIQQQLVHRDRQRLAEQERQQQLEIERQQREELKKHQEELEKLIKQQKEEEEAGSSGERNGTDQIEFSKITNGQAPYTVELARYEVPRVTPQSPTRYEEQTHFQDYTKSHGSQIQQPEPVAPLKTSFENQQYQEQFTNQQQQQHITNQQQRIVDQQQHIANQQQSIANQQQEQLGNQQQQQIDYQQHLNYQQELNNRHNHQQQYVDYREPQTNVQSSRPEKPSRDPNSRRKPTTTTTVDYEIVATTEAPTQPPETLIPYTYPIDEIPVQTTASPEPVTVPTSTSTSPRSRTRRPGGGGGGLPGRRRRPTTTTQEPVTVPEGEYYQKYEEVQQQQQLDPSRRRRIKPSQQTNEETHIERRPNIRKRPGNRVRVNHGEPFEAEIVTEIVQTPANAYKGNTEPSERYIDDTRYISNLPNNQYSDYTSPGSQYTEEQREDTTEIVPTEYQTELTRGNLEEPSNANRDHQRQSVNVVTNIPLEDLFVKTDNYYYDRSTTTAAPLTTSTTTTTTTTTTAPPPMTTSIVKTVTQSSHVSSSTSRLKIRPMRFGNTTRPRFSIKDYKSRMDYKNRLSQSSTTESGPTAQPKQRGSNLKSQPHGQQQPTEYANRETTGRYKYMSRASYRTTTTATPVESTNEQENKLDEQGQQSSSTTERTSNRFTPKRRPVSGNLYRSRISGTSGSRSQQQQQQQQQQQLDSENSKFSTARPENVFSSSIRRRPNTKSRGSTYKDSNYRDNNNKEEVATEMAAEETSFYSAVTTSASLKQTSNDIVIEKSESESLNLPLRYNEESDGDEETKESGPNEETRIEVNAKDRNESPQPEHGVPETLIPTKSSEETQEILGTLTTAENKGETQNKKGEKHLESTTRFDVPSDEEELFAKASQSVADLTSSASALYDKPGMFKAVSPESRVVSPHFKITTDEPTLPIEAFFQELSKKN